MFIDIVILPPPMLSREIGKLNSELSKNYSLKFSVDNKKLFPHLSLYHLVIKLRKLKGLLKELNSLSLKQRALKLKIIGVTKGQHHFSFKVSNPKDLKSLHNKVLTAANSFHFEKTPWLFPLPTKRHKQLFQIYGVPNVLEYFSPHLTLGWANKSSDLAAIYKLLTRKAKKFKSFKADRLAIVKVDNHFQATKILKEFTLKTK